MEHHILVEYTNIENASFPYTTALSEANIKANMMMANTKWTWTCHKKWGFAKTSFKEFL